MTQQDKGLVLQDTSSNIDSIETVNSKKSKNKRPYQLQPIDIRAAFKAAPLPLDFVLPGLLAGTIGVIVSPGGTGKSMLMLESAIGISSGGDFCAIWGQEPNEGRVIYVAGEDPKEVIERRIYALGSYISTDLEEEKICSNLEVWPAYGYGFKIAEETPLGIIASKAWEELAAYLAANPTRLVILDTFNRLLGGISENDSGAMGAVLSIIEQTCRKTGCAVVLVHHTNKASMSGGGADQQAARGSSAITDNARWQVNLSVMDKDEAAARNIDSDEDRRGWVRLDLSKVNYGPPISERWLKRGTSGELFSSEVPDKQAKINKTSRNKRRDVSDDDIPY